MSDLPTAPEQAAGPRRSTQPAPARSAFGTWFDHHLYSVVASLGRLARRPWSTGLTVGVMAVALALPLGLALVLDNVVRLSGHVQQSRQVSVFLKQDTSPDQAAALARELGMRTSIAQVTLRTPAEGLAELRARNVLDKAIDAVGSNPLPFVIVVTPRGDEALLAASLGQLPQVDTVQHDGQWRQRLDGWLRFGGRVAWVLAALLGLGALLVVGNTVRLDIQSRREEIGVLQLLGATDGFIRRPFLYLGAWYGLASGVLAIALLWAAAWALRPPLAELAASYGSDFALLGLDPLRCVGFVFAAVLLGWMGAGIVAGHYLRQTRPTDT